MNRITALVLVLVFLITGCKKEPDPAPIYLVPTEIQPYIDKFIAEASQRGKPITVNNLIVQFGQTSGEDVCGQCLLQAKQTPRITLSINPDCWQNAYPEEREGLVFHELGHCILSRAHRTDQLPDGTYASLMNGLDTGVYATCRYPVGGTVPCDRRSRRAYYLDELFNPTTPIPAWGK